MTEDNMTMVFWVQDPAMLKQVRVGDKVQFEAERASEGITISKLQKAKMTGCKTGPDWRV